MFLAEFYNNESILVLKEDINGHTTWIDSNGDGFILRNGKLVSSFGFENNIEIKNSPDLIQIINDMKAEEDAAKSYIGYIKLTNPKTNFLLTKWNYSILSYGKKKNLISGNLKDYILIREEFHTESIRWKGENHYWVDVNTNQILQAKIELVPNSKKLRLTSLKGYIKK